MPADPIAVVGQWLRNPSDPDVVRSLVAPDATIVTINTHNPELSKILPWTGTSHGPQALLSNLGEMFTRWENQAIAVARMFADGEDVAVFGHFAFRSYSLSKEVTSPFSILATVRDGKMIYLQYQEDSFATAASFRKDGFWIVQTLDGADTFEV
jgi:uncharacterized protein